MAANDQAFPRLDSQAVDPKTGRLTQPWHRFLISLWNRTGGGLGYNIVEIGREAQTALFSDLMTDPVDLQPFSNIAAVQAFASEENQATPSADPVLALVSDDPADAAVAGVQSVTVAASPTSYSPRVAGTLLISGGTITDVSLARRGTTTVLPATTALLPLSPGDAAVVTYTVAPTLTFIPR